MKIQNQLAQELASLMEGVRVEEEFEVRPSSSLCSSLELFLPAILRNKYPSWEKESIDGIFPSSAVRTGEGSARIFGIAILISDQYVTPFLANIDLTSDGCQIRVAEVFVGEAGGGKLGISIAPFSKDKIETQIFHISKRVNEIEWKYKVKFVSH
ncbi:hypothetical protein [Lysobacter sp. M15]|uniref:hypothetical protein n=1 Tax=Lysobacter sp. M15 TaxID=2916837 RepID=UPI001F592500|nr:hypothetical protein [Lysobacter sp. M15]